MKRIGVTTSLITFLAMISACDDGRDTDRESPAGAVGLPRTGQTTSFASGDDGALRRGIAWPSPRFTAGTGEQSQCITDNLTGLMWPKTPDYVYGAESWENAVASAGSSSLCGYNDWRLPNRKELRSLINYGEPDTGAWLNTQGFAITSMVYWTSTTESGNNANAWAISAWAGTVRSENKVDGIYATLPVRGGDSTDPADLPKTGQTTSYVTGDDGNLQNGVAWPNPRFVTGTDVQAECVTDDLTGLMWAKSPDSTTRTWADALTYSDGLSLCGYSDWRLPNINELESLAHAGEANGTAAWLNTQGFTNVQASLYWSSTTYAFDTTGAWGLDMSTGNAEPGTRDSSAYVLPVRGGR